MDPAWNKRLLPLFGLVVGVAAIWALYRESSLLSLSMDGIVHQLSGLSVASLTGACAAMVLSFVGVAGMDALALRYLRRAIPFRRIGAASFVGSAFSNSVGLALLSGGSIRYRFYSAAGLSPADVGKLLAFNGVTFWAGVLTVAGVILLLQGPASPAAIAFGSALRAHLAGAALLGIVFGYLLWCAAASARPLRIWRWELPPPRLSTALGQVSLAVGEWVLSTGVLLILLPHDAGLGYIDFAAVFMLAQLAALASHVPGGIGVFDGVVLLTLPDGIAPAAGAAALIAYRAIYYLLPLMASAIVWAIFEATERFSVVRF